MCSLFIEEQKPRSVYEYSKGFQWEPELVERHVWTPVSCRHTAWTYAPLVRCDNRGRTIPGSRIRNPFIR